jgi:hypothetical protein
MKLAWHVHDYGFFGFVDRVYKACEATLIK